MKNFITVVALFFALSPVAYGQRLAQHRMQAQVGLSGIGILANVADRLNMAEAVEVNLTPALHMAYDYFYTNNVSLGLAVTYQSISVTYRNYTYEENGQTITNDYGTQLKRFNASLRGLFWYNPGSRVKLYSGLRLGFSNWSADTTVPDPTYDPDRFINISLEIGRASCRERV
jgi:hemolysin activation/secretion protein